MLSTSGIPQRIHNRSRERASSHPASAGMAAFSEAPLWKKSFLKLAQLLVENVVRLVNRTDHSIHRQF